MLLDGVARGRGDLRARLCRLGLGQRRLLLLGAELTETRPSVLPCTTSVAKITQKAKKRKLSFLKFAPTNVRGSERLGLRCSP